MSSPRVAPAAEAGPVINDNPSLRRYYQSLESRIGYRLLLGKTRHYGFWEQDTHWPFPVAESLRRMEHQLFERLAVARGSRVLDAGCGEGHVALYMAKQGLQVTAIDVTDHHVASARQTVARSGSLGSQVSVHQMDYHHLESLESESHDGVYTMETLVHATEPLEVLRGFYRILRPGGRLAMHEYDHVDESEVDASKSLKKLAKVVMEHGSMPTFRAATPGYYKRLLEEAGFVDVQETDLSGNLRPMVRLFWALAVVPYWFASLLHLEKHFVNATTGALVYKSEGQVRYVAISARKPKTDMEPGEI